VRFVGMCLPTRKNWSSTTIMGLMTSAGCCASCATWQSECLAMIPNGLMQHRPISASVDITRRVTNDSVYGSKGVDTNSPRVLRSSTRFPQIASGGDLFAFGGGMDLTFSTGSSAAVTTWDADGNVISQIVPPEWYREALRHVSGALGCFYSSGDDLLDCGEELSIVLPLVFNVLCGLPPWAHTGETQEEARKNGARCHELWTKRGINFGSRKPRPAP
jgi:hypothetical protein